MRRQILTAKSGMEEIHEFCFKEFAAVCLFWNFFVLWYSCKITYHPKWSMLIATIPLGLFSQNYHRMIPF